MTNFKQYTKIFSMAAAFFFIAGTAAIAQQTLPQDMQVKEDFTEKEYEDFVKINLQLIPLQEDAQNQMVKAIEDAGLEVQRFQELAQAQQEGTLTEVSGDPEELAKFNQAGQKVLEQQQEVQTQVQETISKSEMSEEQFQQMYMAYNQSEKVRNKIDGMIEKEIKKQ